MLMCIQNLIKLCLFIFEILSRNKILTRIMGFDTVINFRKIIIGNYSDLDLVNINKVHTNFGQILSAYSEDIERNRNSDINQGLLKSSESHPYHRPTSEIAVKARKYIIIQQHR